MDSIPSDHPRYQSLLLRDRIVSGIQKGNARFDEKKLAHINTEQIRRLPLEAFVKLVGKLE